MKAYALHVSLQNHHNFVPEKRFWQHGWKRMLCTCLCKAITTLCLKKGFGNMDESVCLARVFTRPSQLCAWKIWITSRFKKKEADNFLKKNIVCKTKKQLIYLPVNQIGPSPFHMNGESSWYIASSFPDVRSRRRTKVTTRTDVILFSGI